MRRKTTTALVVAFLILGQLLFVGIPANGAVDDPGEAPRASDIIIYNNSSSSGLSQMVYVLNTAGDPTKEGKWETVRVYDSNNKLLGEALEVENPSVKMACVPVSRLTAGDTIYVSRHYPDFEKETARVPKIVPKAKSPKITFPHYLLKDTELDQNKELTTPLNNSSWKGSPVTNFNHKEQGFFNGDYFCVDVNLSGFRELGSLEFSLKYDTEKFELLTFDNVNNVPKKTAAVSPAAGAPSSDAASNMTLTKGGEYYTNSYGYGMVLGTDFNKLDSLAATASNYSPYINTTTGHIRFSAVVGASTGEMRQFGEYNDAGDLTKDIDPANVLRLFFRYKGADGQFPAEGAVTFASRFDCPEEYRDNKDMAKRYYDVYQYSSAIVSLSGVNVLEPLWNPPVNYPTFAQISATDMNDVGTLTKAISEEQLLENSVKVYNYVNSTDSSRIDYGIDDLLVYQNPYGEKVNEGDMILVEKLDSEGKTESREAPIQPGEGKAIIKLGGDFLDRNGGDLTVVKYRAVGGISVKAKISYKAEADRDVRVEIIRGGVEKGSAATDVTDHPEKIGSIARDERIQLRFYFNKFDDLTMYSLPIHFNSKVVQVADRNFVPVKSGAVNHSEIKENVKGISLGADMKNVSTSEQVLYTATYLNNVWDETALLDAIKKVTFSELAGIYVPGTSQTDAELLDAGKEVVLDIAQRINWGAGSSSDWYGGLAFMSQEAGHAENYPYIKNDEVNFSDNGLVKVLSTSMINSGATLSREGGYNFININFVGTGVSGSPEFRFATKEADGYDSIAGSEAYDTASEDGAMVMLKYPEGVVDDPSKYIFPTQANDQWVVLGDDDGVLEVPEAPEMELKPGNSGDANTPDDIYVYYGEDFIDPGYTVTYKNDTTLYPGTVERELQFAIALSDGSSLMKTVKLTPENEKDVMRTVLNSANSNKFIQADITMAYTATQNLVTPDPDNPDAVIPPNKVSQTRVTRPVHVIHKRGDINRDGTIDINDYNMLKDHIAGKSKLDAVGDEGYLTAVGDIDQNGKILFSDLNYLKMAINQLKQIPQDYTPITPE